jgi:hypothetical protein
MISIFMFLLAQFMTSESSLHCVPTDTSPLITFCFFLNHHFCGFSHSCRFVVRQRDAVLPSRAPVDTDVNAVVDPEEKLRFRPLRSHKVLYCQLHLCCHDGLPGGLHREFLERRCLLMKISTSSEMLC